MERVNGMVSAWESLHENRWWYWAPVLGYAVLIFYLSSLPYPGKDLPSAFGEVNDKLIHCVEYGVLAVLLYRALRWGAGPHWAARAWWAAVLCAVLYGVSDELHQSFVPPREMDPYDVAADSVGAVVAATVWRRVTER